jgi:hypothetical protein
MKTTLFQLITIGLLMASHAQAADHGASFALGSLANSDPSYNLFGGGQNMTSWGFQGSYAFHDRFALIGSYQRHERGAEVYTQSNDWADSNFLAAYAADRFGLGVKADITPLKALQLYSSAQALLYRADIKLDAEPDSRTNIGQVKASGLSAGAQIVGGFEIKVRPKALPFHFGWYTEFGYGIIAKHSYRSPQDVNTETQGFDDEAEIMSMQPGGFVMSSGIGLRF